MFLKRIKGIKYFSSSKGTDFFFLYSTNERERGLTIDLFLYHRKREPAKLPKAKNNPTSG